MTNVRPYTTENTHAKNGRKEEAAHPRGGWGVNRNLKYCMKQTV